MILLVSTNKGLQTLLDITYDILGKSDLKINVANCLSISIKCQPKQRTSVIQHSNFKVGDKRIPALRRTETWKYFSIDFDPMGRAKFQPAITLEISLDDIEVLQFVASQVISWAALIIRS